MSLTFDNFDFESEEPTPSNLNIHQQLMNLIITNYFLNSVLNESEIRGVRGFQKNKRVEVEQMLQFLFENWQFLAQLLVRCLQFDIILFEVGNLCP